MFGKMGKILLLLNDCFSAHFPVKMYPIVLTMQSRISKDITTGGNGGRPISGPGGSMLGSML